MIKLDMNKFIDDIKTGVLDKSITNAYGDYGYNISHYVFSRQKNTRLYDYVNNDVYIFIDKKDPEYNYIEDYGNGIPDWAYDTIKDMAKAIKAVQR